MKSHHIIIKKIITETDQGDGLNLRSKQKSPLKDEDDSVKLNPFKKLPDDETKPSDSPLDQEPTKQSKIPKGKSDNSGDKASLPMKKREEDTIPITKPGTFWEWGNFKLFSIIRHAK